jgi:hypothetical protein
MHSFWADRANPSYSTQIHPALSSFADECCATLARLLAYVGTLALLAIAGIHFWDQLAADEPADPSAKPGWNLAGQSHPAFAVSQLDSLEKTGTYEILRHPQGGRKDIIRWVAEDEDHVERPVAELEIYRPGGEFGHQGAALAEMAARMDPGGGRALEAADIIDSKFGPMTLLRWAGSSDGPRACLGFIKRIDQPLLQLLGWSCQGDTLPARRAAISCILSRLMLLTAGNDPKLAELFARAELKRGSCAPSASTIPSADWVTGAEIPPLRGTL